MALILAPLVSAPRTAVAKTSSEMQRAQQEAEQRRREAEQQRREAEQRRREAERQRREAAQEAARLRREAERQKKLAERQPSRQQKQPQDSKSAAQNKASGSASEKEAKGASSTDATDKSGNGSESDDKPSEKSAKDPASESPASEITEDLSSPPPTMEKLLKRWLAPAGAAQQVERENMRRANAAQRRMLSERHENRALKPWISKTKPVPVQVTPAPLPSKSADRAESALAKTKKTDPAPETVPAAEPAKISSGPIGRPPPLELGLPPPPELLAVNASAETVARARQLGFGVGHASKFSKLKFSVTRLVAPKGVSTAQAKAMLKEKFPTISIEPNNKYRIYKTATGVEDAGRPVGAPSKGVEPGACTSEQCFPSRLIGWRPDLNRCANGAKIGIIDTSVDLTHPAFAGKKLTVAHFGKNNPPEPDWHGTGVAAILAGDSKSGTPGLIPGASFYLADVFHADDDGQPASDTLSMLRAFDWLEARGVKIINLSLSGPRDELIRKAVAKLSAKGIVLVAAAGNDGPSAEPSYPAAYDDVIAVTAVNRQLHSYRYANRGSYIDVAAPGVSIWTALPGARQGFHSGTSFATPYITATLAAVTSRYPNADASSLLEKLDYQDLGEPGRDPIYGNGLIRAPQTCGGGAVAQAVVNQTGSTTTARSPGFARASAGRSPEVLPWLSLHD